MALFLTPYGFYSTTIKYVQQTKEPLSLPDVGWRVDT